MPTTARDIIDAARSRSTFNDAELLGQDAEFIRRIDLRLQELVSSINQLATPADIYFAAEAVVDPAGGAWTRPADADVIMQAFGGGSFGTGADAKVAPGVQINIVPQNDRTHEVPPAIYPFGASFRSSGRGTDPVASANGDRIRFVYARFLAPLDPTVAANHANNTLDAAWPERFSNLLVVDLVRYLMVKDTRFTVEGGAEALAAEEERSFALLTAHVVRVNRGMRTRFAQRPGADAG